MKPILFSAPMVQALLAGRKTQTRRIVKGIPEWNYYPAHSESRLITGRVGFVNLDLPNPYDDTVDVYPRYTPGDVLYVRETYAVVGHTTKHYVYRADGDRPDVAKWKPSIHMPREAARIFLEVTDVKVERLQSISEVDAIAEGVFSYQDPSFNERRFRDYLKPKCNFRVAKSSFTTLWRSINGPGSWEANPWVWVYSFKRIENQDQHESFSSNTLNDDLG